MSFKTASLAVVLMLPAIIFVVWDVAKVKHQMGSKCHKQRYYSQKMEE